MNEEQPADSWESQYPGQCDICRTPTPITEITPGVDCGWKSGYMCAKCAAPPPQPQATKLPTNYDAALLGATVSTIGADQFVYSLRKLITLVMSERSCQPPEARQVIYHEMIRPFSGEVTFVNDELVEGEVEPEKSKIIITTRINGKHWRA